MRGKYTHRENTLHYGLLFGGGAGCTSTADFNLKCSRHSHIDTFNTHKNNFMLNLFPSYKGA
jgi:hypothetical protein